MAAQHKPQPPLAQEALQHAFAVLQRPGWPADLAGALAHPIYSVVVRGLARSRQRKVMHARSALQAPAPQTLRGHALHKPAAASCFDGKRAAANDLDD